jgi:hypothetical protein
MRASKELQEMPMEQVNAEQLRAFRMRWQLVEEIEAEEQRTNSMELRLQQLNSLFGMASALGWLEPDSEEILTIVRERWRRLKEHNDGNTTRNR